MLDPIGQRLGNRKALWREGFTTFNEKLFMVWVRILVENLLKEMYMYLIIYSGLVSDNSSRVQLYYNKLKYSKVCLFNKQKYRQKKIDDVACAFTIINTVLLVNAKTWLPFFPPPSAVNEHDI